MGGKRKQYTPEFKFKVVLESLQRDTTLETDLWVWEYTRCSFIRHACSRRRQAWRPGMKKEEGID